MFKQLMLASVAGFVLTIGTAGLPITETGIVGAPPAHAFLGKIKKAAKKVGKGVKKGAKKVSKVTKKGAKKVGKVTKKGAKKVGKVTKKGAKKVGRGLKKGAKITRGVASGLAGGTLVVAGGVAGKVVKNTGRVIGSDKVKNAGKAIENAADECFRKPSCVRRVGDAALTGGLSEAVRRGRKRIGGSSNGIKTPNQNLKSATRLARTKMVRRPTVDGRTVTRRKMQSAKLVGKLPKVGRKVQLKTTTPRLKHRIVRKRSIKRNTLKLRRVQQKAKTLRRLGGIRTRVKRSNFRMRRVERRSTRRMKVTSNKIGGGQRRRRR